MWAAAMFIKATLWVLGKSCRYGLPGSSKAHCAVVDYVEVRHNLAHKVGLFCVAPCCGEDYVLVPAERHGQPGYAAQSLYGGQVLAWAKTAELAEAGAEAALAW